MRKFFLFVTLFVLASASLYGDEAAKKYTFRAAYGVASEKDLGEILFSADFSRHPIKELDVVALDAGYLLEENLFDMPFDLYLKGGFSRFNEVTTYTKGTITRHDGSSSSYEVLAYIKLFYNLDFSGGSRMRFGFGEGVSYVNHKLVAELYDALDENTGVMDPTAKFLNYLDITVDFDMGRTFGVESLKDVYLGYLLKHRSGVFGLFSGVHGGSNYNSLYVEMKF